MLAISNSLVVTECSSPVVSDKVGTNPLPATQTVQITFVCHETNYNFKVFQTVHSLTCYN